MKMLVVAPIVDVGASRAFRGRDADKGARREAESVFQVSSSDLPTLRGV